MIQRRATHGGEVRYDVRLRAPNGTERSKTFRTKKEAERYERSQQTTAEQGAWIDPRSSKVSWAHGPRRDLVDAEWQRTVVHLRQNTRRIYERNLRLHILPDLGDVEIGKLTPSMLRAWIAELSSRPKVAGKPLSPASVAQAYRVLNRVLVAAVENELLARNPLHGVKPPRAESKEMRFLDHAEVAALADAIDERYRAYILVAAYCGLRVGEMAALRRINVDVLHRSISVVEQVQYAKGRYEQLTPKTAAGRRSAALPRFVADAVQVHLAVHAEAGPNGLVFPAPAGGHLHLPNFRKRVWLPATAAAGVAPLRVHDLRHTCASLAIAAGADIKVLQRMLGHASAALTLDRYGHLMPGQAASVADRLDAMAVQAKAPPAVHLRRGG